MATKSNSRKRSPSTELDAQPALKKAKTNTTDDHDDDAHARQLEPLHDAQKAYELAAMEYEDFLVEKDPDVYAVVTVGVGDNRNIVLEGHHSAQGPYTSLRAAVDAAEGASYRAKKPMMGRYTTKSMAKLVKAAEAYAKKAKVNVIEWCGAAPPPTEDAQEWDFNLVFGVARVPYSQLTHVTAVDGMDSALSVVTTTKHSLKTVSM